MICVVVIFLLFVIYPLLFEVFVFGIFHFLFGSVFCDLFLI